jgi:hypothetical protein
MPLALYITDSTLPTGPATWGHMPIFEHQDTHMWSHNILFLILPIHDIKHIYDNFASYPNPTARIPMSHLATLDSTSPGPAEDL